MSELRSILDGKAKLVKAEHGRDISELAREFSEFNRWTGSNPLLLVGDAAATVTGLGYFARAKPIAERFADEFVQSGRVTTLAELSAVPEEELADIYPHPRMVRVLLGIARELGGTQDDLTALQSWAADADPYQHHEDPIGGLNGVGLRTFQYLRMLTGENTLKPDTMVQRFVDRLAIETGVSELVTTTDEQTLRSCEWLSTETGYSLLELDQLAWWTESTIENEPIKRGSTSESSEAGEGSEKVPHSRELPIRIELGDEAESPNHRTSEIRTVMANLSIGERLIYQTEQYQKTKPLNVRKISEHEEDGQVVRTIGLVGPRGGRQELVDDTAEVAPYGQHVKEGRKTRQGTISVLIVVAGAVE